MANRKPNADIIPFPRSVRLDVRDALLNNQSAPKVPRPAELDAAIDRKARSLAEEAFQLCREHLRRRVAFNSEIGYPDRIIDMERAHQVLEEGDLADALSRAYKHKLESIVFQAQSAARISEQFSDLADKVAAAAGVDGRG